MNQFLTIPSFLKTDKQLCLADRYLIIADEVILSEASNMLEAMTALVHLAFTLDLNYPKMPLTFEFIER